MKLIKSNRKLSIDITFQLKVNCEKLGIIYMYIHTSVIYRDACFWKAIRAIENHVYRRIVRTLKLKLRKSLIPIIEIIVCARGQKKVKLLSSERRKKFRKYQKQRLINFFILYFWTARKIRECNFNLIENRKVNLITKKTNLLIARLVEVKKYIIIYFSFTIK